MKISWTEAGLENGFWSANGGEAFRLKSTPTTPILPGYENLNRGGVSNIWGAAERVQGRPGGLDKASRAPHPKVWPLVFWKIPLLAPLSNIFWVLGLGKKKGRK